MSWERPPSNKANTLGVGICSVHVACWEEEENGEEEEEK